MDDVELTRMLDRVGAQRAGLFLTTGGGGTRCEDRD